jgi:hypothetical protein
MSRVQRIRSRFSRPTELLPLNDHFYLFARP